jgi:hypothetical protein
MPSSLKHCRKYGWLAGDCDRLTCQRCGKAAYGRVERRIVKSAARHKSLLFLTIYYDPRWLRDLSHLPLFKDHKREVETAFKALLSKIFRSLRDKARRAGCSFDYCIVLALSKVKHRVHKVLHAHALLTWLPDPKPKKNSKRTDRLECLWLDEKLAGLHLIGWLEKPRSNQAVARYTAQNARTVIGKKDYAGMRVYRMSQGYEK